MDAVKLFQAKHQFIEFFLIVHIDLDITLKHAFLRLDGDGIDIKPQFTRNQVSDLVYDAYIVETEYADTSKEGYLLFLAHFVFTTRCP